MDSQVLTALNEYSLFSFKLLKKQEWGASASPTITLDWDLLRGHPGKHVGYLLGLEKFRNLDLAQLNSFLTPQLIDISGEPAEIGGKTYTCSKPLPCIRSPTILA